MKCIRPDVIVFEDLMTSQTGFSVDRIFSKLNDKAKILTSRRERLPFPLGPKTSERKAWLAGRRSLGHER